MIGVEDGPLMVTQLAERRVFVDARPRTGLRISPHFFNTDAEIELAVSALKEIVGWGARLSAPARGG